MLILLGLAGNDLFQQTWKVIHCRRTCDLASAFRQGCQITNFTKFKINSRKLESTLLHKYSLVLRQHVINFQQWHFGGKDSKHLRLSSSYGSILLGLAGKRGQGSQMQSIGQCMLALWNFDIIYPHLDMKLFFLPTISTGFQAGELGEIHFGLGTTPAKWCETWGRGEISRRAATKSACVQIKQTISSWCKNVGQNLSQLKQY